MIVGGIDSYTVLMAQGENFTDSSSMGHTLTTVGTVTIDTSTKKLGTGSFALSSSCVSIADSPAWTWGTNPVTIDFWVNLKSLGSVGNYFGLCSIWPAAPNKVFSLNILRYDTNGYYLKFYQSTNGSAEDSFSKDMVTTPVVDTWYHIALTKVGSTFTFYQDGVSCGSSGMNDGFADVAGALLIGSGGLGSDNFYGNVEGVRVSKGISRYSGNFTPPIKAYSTAAYYARPMAISD